MIQNRLEEVFLSLSALELRQLAKYVRSPLFNKLEVVVELFDYLRKRKDKGWTDELLHQHLFPEKPFNASKLHYAKSDLVKRIESYLIWKACTDSKLDSQLYLMKSYRRKKLDKAFYRSLGKMEEILEKQELRNESYLFYQYEIQKEMLLHEKEKKRSAKFQLQEFSDAQDISFIAHKLKNACTILSHQSILKNEYDQGVLYSLIERIDSHSKYLEYPAISIFYYAYKALSNLKDDASFESLKELLSNKIEVFTHKEQRDIYILTTNYCIKKLNTGAEHFIREAFETYRLGLGKNVFIENGILSRWTYNNIIVLGLKLKEFFWVETFIYDYKEYLDEETKEDSFNFNLAKFYFEKKDYKTTMTLLLQTKYDDILHVLGAKMMLVKMYYELKELDSLESLLDSFKTFISRKKDIGYHKENYLNIISFVKQLIYINDKKELNDLVNKIEGTKILTEKKWLLQQVDSKI